MYYTMRNAVPEFFKDRDVTKAELAEIMDVMYVYKKKYISKIN